MPHWLTVCIVLWSDGACERRVYHEALESPRICMLLANAIIRHDPSLRFVACTEYEPAYPPLLLVPAWRFYG